MEKQQLEQIRHSCAHLVAAAVQALYPEAKFGVGPVIENGFYYDIEFPENIKEEDLGKIEAKAREIAKQGLAFERKEIKIDDAIKYFESVGQNYKVELLNDLKTKGTTKMSAEELQDVGGAVENVSLYQTGEFADLCRGPHIETTKGLNLSGLKLMRLAGAYWRGKSDNPQLQRIYGVYFETKNELTDYLNLLAEAEKRDHRKIGAEQELFFFDDRVGKGQVLWLSNGTIIRNEVEKLALESEEAGNYLRVRTPHLAKEELFLTSGHLPYYKDSMYPPMVMDDGTYYLKAMNCPHHHTVYNFKPHSYRELPMRLAEYGECFRNELSGTLAGLLRVRAMAMNDAHIYCTKDQIKDEFKKVMEMVMEYFRIFKLEDYWFRLSKWSPDHLEKYVNEPDNWNYSEGIIREVLQEMKVKFVEAEDEAAFYGPKVDVLFKSVVGREETMSTIQLDFVAKARFGLKYTDCEGKENNEVFVIHRAPLSTHERFMAFLIEHFAGVWPVWMSPVQIMFAPVASAHVEGAKKLAGEFKSVGIRVETDDADETVGNKVRKAVGRKIPYIVVVGDKELAGGELMVRVRGEEKPAKFVKEEFLARVQREIKDRV